MLGHRSNPSSGGLLGRSLGRRPSRDRIRDKRWRIGGGTYATAQRGRYAVAADDVRVRGEAVAVTLRRHRLADPRHERRDIPRRRGRVLGHDLHPERPREPGPPQRAVLEDHAGPLPGGQPQRRDPLPPRHVPDPRAHDRHGRHDRGAADADRRVVPARRAPLADAHVRVRRRLRGGPGAARVAER